MITFLNEKNNWELHLAFFDAIVDVATQIGHRSLDIVEALLQQVRLNILAQVAFNCVWLYNLQTGWYYTCN